MRRALATASSVSMTPVAAAVAPSAGPSVVSARDVSKTFGTRKALNGVSVEVAAGEMVALIGPSGSGKSTLLRSITGLQTIDPGKGTISVFGEVVQKNGRTTGATRAARQKLGMVFQQFNLVGRLSLFANVMLGALGRIPGWKGLLGAWPTADKKLAMAALHRVGVSDYAAQRANTLSGGQQQRGAIARALVRQAPILLLDEATSALDAENEKLVQEALDAAMRGRTTLVIAHRLATVLKADRIVVMDEGRVVETGTHAELTARGGLYARFAALQFTDAAG
jgi:phosphonate transport system ATP-binding protein